MDELEFASSADFFYCLLSVQLNEKGVEMDFRRGHRDIRLDAIPESGAHKPAGRSRFSGREHTAAKNRGDISRSVLRLSFPRNEMAVVQPCRTGVMAGGKRCEGGATTSEFFRLAGG